MPCASTRTSRPPSQPLRAAKPHAADEVQGTRLHKALLGETLNSVAGDMLVLDPSSTFEEIFPGGVAVPLTGDGPREFDSHTIYHLPRDIKMLRNISQQRGKIDVLHRFVVRDFTALNDGLTEWALNRERKCTIAKRDTLAGTARPEQLSDLGKTVASNRGGYQSLSNIFQEWSAPPLPPLPLAADPLAPGRSGARTETTDDPKELAGRPHLCNLHRIASEALDQASCMCMRMCTPPDMDMAPF